MSQTSESGSFITAHPRGSVIAVAVVPRSAKNQIELSPHGILRIRVTAPPVEGAANAAVLKLLAETIGVPRSRLEIISGERGRRKRILVAALTPDELITRLSPLPAARR